MKEDTSVKNYAKFEKVSIKQIRPKGWLGAYLKDMESGLTGNMEVAGYPFNKVGWDKFDIDTTSMNENPGWWAYEQTAYMVDGMERAGELLRSGKLKKKAEKSFSFTLENTDEDGYIGPKLLKKSNGWNRWPHVVFFRALLAKYSATKDKSIIEALKNHYLGHEQDYSNLRDVMNVEIMLLVYIECGDERLLKLAEKSFLEYNEKCKDDNCVRAQLSNKKAYAHGVTYNEYSKLGALLYICTGKKEYLRPSVKAYKKIDKYHMLPDGCHCSNEFLLDNNYRQAHETCDITDYTWALNYLLMATGKAEYADKIERCVLNAGIGAVDEKFRALQYFSTLNQLVLDRTANHCDFLQGDKWMSYRPNPGTECCAGNVNRFFPNYCASMWFKKGRNSIYSTLFGASEYKHSGSVKIKEVTDFPFSDTVKYEFEMKAPQNLKFNVRIPAWCTGAVIKLNGEKIDFVLKNGFALVERIFNDSDAVEVELPSELKLVENRDGVYIEKGPLLYTYGMYGKREIDTAEINSSKDFPAYNIYPDKKWNYGLCTDGDSLNEIKIVKGEMSDHPFSVDTAPIKIEVNAKEIFGWKFQKKNVIRPVYNLYTLPWKREKKEGKFTFTPPLPSDDFIKKHGLGEVEKITLVPYGAAKVRLTVFKKV